MSYLAVLMGEARYSAYVSGYVTLDAGAGGGVDVDIRLLDDIRSLGETTKPLIAERSAT